VEDVLDLREVERELCRLPEVNAARIVEDEIGRPVEVHILASRDKHAKQIVRDVQSVAMATFGLDLDRRVVSVVQLEGGSGDERVIGNGANNGGGGGLATAVASRVLIEGITAEKRGVRMTVQVTLILGGEAATGAAEGSVASSARYRLVAQATLEALRQLVPAADAADAEMATVLRVGSRDVAVTSVVFVVPPFEEVASGSAVVRESGEEEAVARSVLDAVNRRLGRAG
jgi:hypothetical protein